MNDLKIIKKRLLKEERIEELLELMGCEKIKYEQGGELIVAQLPAKFHSNNPRSVQIRLNESLTSAIRSRGVKGDIFSIVSYIVKNSKANELQDSLYDAKSWIIEMMNYHDIIDGRYNNQKQSNVNDWLKELKKKRNKNTCIDYEENTPIDEKIKNEYVMYPYKEWIDENISWKTQMKFEVGYDLKTDRVVNMIRNKEGKLIGVKGRYVGDNQETLKEKKYIYLHKMNKSVELFNIHRALPYILKKKSVIVFEGYKSVMKSYDMGLYNCVSIEGDSISPVQVSLLKEIGIDIKIILAFDKDKMKLSVDEETGEVETIPKHILNEGSSIKNRDVYAIVDTNNLLDEKDSPVDKGKKVFVKLYKNKIKLPVENIFSK